ncbi:MAG TPA: hypothetical protein VMV69_28525 [Pirellulales bacterium]|nr:hypothetical protein [Pirellulales bacterium]
MIQKRVLVAERLRRPPSTGWSWMDRRFVRDHAAQLSRDAVQLYFFLAAVSDGQGLSFYGDPAVAALLRMPLDTLIRARDELIANDLIAWQAPLTQVLSLPVVPVRRRREPGQGLIQLADLLRSANAESSTSSARENSRRLP